MSIQAWVGLQVKPGSQALQVCPLNLTPCHSQQPDLHNGSKRSDVFSFTKEILWALRLMRLCPGRCYLKSSIVRPTREGQTLT